MREWQFPGYLGTTTVMKQFLRGINVSIVALLLVFLVLELGFHLVYDVLGHIPGYIPIHQQRYIDILGTPRWMPNSVAWYKPILPGDEPTKITFNSIGIRGPEIGAKQSLRIAIIGDSISFNGAVPYEQTYSYLLEQELRKTIQDPTLEVLNFSVEDTNLEQYWLILTNQVLEFKPDMVIINFYLNDLAQTLDSDLRRKGLVKNPVPKNQTSFRLYSYEKLTYHLHRLRILYDEDTTELFRWLPTFLSRKYRQDNNLWKQMRTEAAKEWGVSWIPEKWELARDIFSKMKILAEQENFSLIWAMSPATPQIELDQSFDQLFFPQQQAEFLAKQLGIPFIDFLPVLRAGEAKLKEKLTYDQCHLTPKGSIVIAHFLAKTLLPYVASVKEHMRINSTKETLNNGTHLP